MTFFFFYFPLIPESPVRSDSSASPLKLSWLRYKNVHAAFPVRTNEIEIAHHILSRKKRDCSLRAQIASSSFHGNYKILRKEEIDYSIEEWIGRRLHRLKFINFSSLIFPFQSANNYWNLSLADVSRA